MKPKSSETAIVLFAHGSRVEEANAGVRELAREVERRGPYRYVRPSFLELAPPDLASAVHEAAAAGFKRIVVIPYFLTPGLHLRRDLPTMVRSEKRRFPELEIVVGQPLEGHPLMASMILERIHDALGGPPPRDA
jgi:sirohydrochlorin ferrochelatase